MEEELNNVGSDWIDKSPLDDTYIPECEESEYDVHSSPLYGEDGLPEDLLEEIKGIRYDTNNNKPEVSGFVLDESPSCIPYKDDIIELSLSPEVLNIVINTLKSYSVNISKIENDNVSDLYTKQTQCRDTIDELDSYLNKYVRNRPWHPLLKKWVNTIGKDAIRKDVDVWSV